MSMFRLTVSACSLMALVAAGGCVVLPGQPSSGPAAPRIRDAGPNRTLDQRRADFPISHDDYARLGYRLDWIGYPTITGSLPVEQIFPQDDFVAVVERGGRLTVLETGTGARRCGDQLGTQLTRFMGLARIGDGSLFIATQAEVFRLNPATCNMVGRFRTEKIVSTSPVIFGNLAIFGTGAGEILAHGISGAAQGVKAWGFGTGGAIEGAPVLIGETIGAVSQNGEVTFVSAQTGSLIGRARIWGGLSTNPVGDDYTLYVASLDQSIYAFAADGGAMLWRYRTPYPLTVQPTLHQASQGSVLYAAVQGQGLVALNGSDGSVLWKNPDFSGTVVAVNRGRLLAFDGRTAALIDPQRGDIIERVTLPGATILKPDRFEDGNLYVVSRSGVVAKFNLR